MPFINIPATETGLPFALEQYYSQLNLLVGQRDDQPLLLNNTITTFDIVAAAPFYSEGVFRHFADRKFQVSPKDLGTAIQADRFSIEYERVIKIATTRIDTTIDQSVLAKIASYNREITRVTNDILDYEEKVRADWDKIAEREKITPDTPKYELRHINYLESIMYADRKKGFTEELEEYHRYINTLRESSYTPNQQKLIRAADELSESYKIARPWNTYFERDYPNATVMTFADATVRSRQLCDVSPAIYPSSNLVIFQTRNGESRNIFVEENTENNSLHTKIWGGGGGGSFSAFGVRIGGGGGGSGESSYASNFKKLSSFEMDFAGIEEIYAERGVWFDPSLFSDPELSKIFDKIPGARDLEYVAVSLIIGRGLKLKLKFSTDLRIEEWTKKVFQASGGVSAFGFRFGGSGSSTSYDYNLSVASDKKSVEFQDDAHHCRLLAVRLERIYHPPKSNHPQLSENSILAQKALVTGRISLAAYQNLKINNFTDDLVKSALLE